MLQPADAHPRSVRQEIMATAGRLFADNGYDGTSVADICAESEQNVGSVYWHFKNKADLFDAVVQEGFSRYLQSLPDPADVVGTPSEKLRTYFESAGEIIAAQPAVFRIRLALLTLNESKTPQAFASVNAAGEILAQNVVAVVRSAIADLDVADPDDLAREITTLVIDMTSGILVRAAWDTRIIVEGVQHLIKVVELCIAGAERELWRQGRGEQPQLIHRGAVRRLGDRQPRARH